MTAASLKSTAVPPVLLKRYAYGYDAAGNRTSLQADDSVQMTPANSRNQLTSMQAGGPLRFAGSVNEPATVTVQASPAVVASDNSFSGSAAVGVGSGTTNVAVVATDASNNVRTSTYQVPNASGATTTYTYDDDGNLVHLIHREKPLM